jgi:hypothetical protein
LAHARSEHTAHLFGGLHGAHVLGSLQLNELSRRLGEEDLLRAYGRWQQPGVAKEEEDTFLRQLDPSKHALAKEQLTQKQMEALLAKVPRLLDASGELTDRIDFYSLQKCVQIERAHRIKRLSKMYPDARRGGGGKAARAAAEAAAKGEEAKESVNGVSWHGESILTAAMLARQYPPHQAHALRERLMNKHSHDCVQLESINHPSVQLSVQLMRNARFSDHTEGWTTFF